VTGDKKPRVDIWSLPILVKTPFFGLLTMGDILLILLILFVVLWYFIKYAVYYVDMVNHMDMKGHEDVSK
jgi:hypothetical protein